MNIYHIIYPASCDFYIFNKAGGYTFMNIYHIIYPHASRCSFFIPFCQHSKDMRIRSLD